MRFAKPLLLIAAALCMTPAWGAAKTRTPHIGYVYPAGGQQGTTMHIIAGGQFLNGVSAVYFSGGGVNAAIVDYVKPFTNKQLRYFQRMLGNIIKKRPPSEETPLDVVEALRESAGRNEDMLALLDHPMIKHLEGLNLNELRMLADKYKKQPPGAQLAELAVIDLEIGLDAASGVRELRLETPNGLTNPMRFEVASFPEIQEQEPNDLNAPPDTSAIPPVVLNGQILPGDVDRFRIQAKCGQQLVFEAKARSLIPYLADAVPGWFQATLALYGPDGKEAAYDDDYLFDPDPVLFYTIPEDGQYEVEIRDAIYRGREDFVYRVAIAELPFITQIYPLGGRSGVKQAAQAEGWNLANHAIPLDTTPGEAALRTSTFPQGKYYSNPVAYAVDTLPESEEKEPNNTAQDAQPVDLPRIINGRIDVSGDVDVYRFKGRTGDNIVAEVCARRLNSPLDSLLRLTDAKGRQLAWNDDYTDREMGLLTHHADSFLSASLPEDGEYFVQLSDAQLHGDVSYAYRLRISPARPDFALRATPSSLSVPQGRTMPLCVHALRKEGFTGDIELSLKDAPEGFRLSGGRIPAGCDRIYATLTAPRAPIGSPIALQLEGRAEINGQTVCRPAVPAEDMMQAFIYQHLVPSQELLVAVSAKKRPFPPVKVLNELPLEIPLGGTAQLQIRVPKRADLDKIQWALWEPPKGLSLKEAAVLPNGFDITLQAENDATLAGNRNNLILEAFMEVQNTQKSGKKAPQTQRVPLGVLPAIPMSFTKP